MPVFRLGSRYSRWDGTQEIGAFDADELMRAISDDLLQDGDLNRALQRLFRWGFQRPDGEHVPGLREMLQRLKERRQEQLNRFDLGSMLDDIKERLEQIVATERAGIQRRLEEAGAQPPPQAEQAADGADQGREAGDGEQGGRPNQASPQASSQSPAGQQSRAQGEPGGEGGAAEDSQTGDSPTPDPDLRQMMERLAARKLEQLDHLPGDPGGAIRQLHDYEFMDAEARRMFQELLAMLQQQVLQSTFQGMQQALAEMTPEDLAEMRQMMRELNEMLEARQRGEDPNFEQFMHKWGHYFGPDVKSLDDLLEHDAAPDGGDAAADGVDDAGATRATRGDGPRRHAGRGDPGGDVPAGAEPGPDDDPGRLAQPLPLLRRRVADAERGDATDGSSPRLRRARRAIARSARLDRSGATRRRQGARPPRRGGARADAPTPADHQVAGGGRLHPQDPPGLGADAAGRPQDRREGAARHLRRPQEGSSSASTSCNATAAPASAPTSPSPTSSATRSCSTSRRR